MVTVRAAVALVSTELSGIPDNPSEASCEEAGCVWLALSPDRTGGLEELKGFSPTAWNGNRLFQPVVPGYEDARELAVDPETGLVAQFRLHWYGLPLGREKVVARKIREMMEYEFGPEDWIEDRDGLYRHAGFVDEIDREYVLRWRVVTNRGEVAGYVSYAATDLYLLSGGSRVPPVAIEERRRVYEEANRQSQEIDRIIRRNRSR